MVYNGIVEAVVTINNVPLHILRSSGAVVKEEQECRQYSKQ